MPGSAPVMLVRSRVSLPFNENLGVMKERADLSLWRSAANLVDFRDSELWAAISDRLPGRR